MATSDSQKTGTDVTAQATSKGGGQTIDPGPYIGIVRGYVEGTRMGQLKVEIPELQGKFNPGDQGLDTDDFPTVTYASPFFGQTYGTDTGAAPNSPATAGQSYGMWFVPPDIGTQVLVTFVGGQKNRGYWFGCVVNTPSHHMVPAIGRHIGGAANTLNPADSLNPYINSSSVLPVVEADSSDPTLWSSTGIAGAGRYPHEYQTMILASQGLDQDPIRGAISSSSSREVPSNVYGISTPGRKATKTDQVPIDPQAVLYRKGGHTFVMDDGAAGDDVNPAGTDQLIRLRTSGGHQILMNDTENILYIASASGEHWIELSANGSLNIYAAAGFNVRSEGVMNLCSDSAIIMDAPQIVMNAAKAIALTTQGTFSTSAATAASITAGGSASLSGATASVKGTALASLSGGFTNISGGLINISGGLGAAALGAATSLLGKGPGYAKTQSTLVPSYNGTNWVANNKALQTICTVTPGHEPWDRNQTPGSAPSTAAASVVAAGINTTVAAGTASSTGTTTTPTTTPADVAPGGSP